MHCDAVSIGDDVLVFVSLEDGIFAVGVSEGKRVSVDPAIVKLVGVSVGCNIGIVLTKPGDCSGSKVAVKSNPDPSLTIVGAADFAKNPCCHHTRAIMVINTITAIVIMIPRYFFFQKRWFERRLSGNGPRKLLVSTGHWLYALFKQVVVWCFKLTTSIGRERQQ